MPYKIELRPYKNWSGKPGSNWRPQPWQGCALPAELFPLMCINTTFVSWIFNLLSATSTTPQLRPIY
jgi:hypothetical protein